MNYTDMEGRAWWEDIQSPYHPSWRLDTISDRDISKLKTKATSESDNSMVVENFIYLAFLSKPFGSLLPPQKTSFYDALEHLESAEIHIEENIQIEEAAVGYGIVINAMRAWLTKEEDHKIRLEELLNAAKLMPKHEDFISIVHAYILSRLGPKWLSEAIVLYEEASLGYPDNWQWLLGKAMMIGRHIRQNLTGHDWTDEAKDCNKALLQKERVILEDVLKLQPECHIAKAHLGRTLLLINPIYQETAFNYINEAYEHEPQSTKIALIAANCYRKIGDVKAEKILRKSLDIRPTADCHHLLGETYRSRAIISGVARAEATRLRRVALEHFTAGRNLDSCHIPSRAGEAEMSARIGNTKAAKRLYTNLFDQAGEFTVGSYLIVYERALHLGQSTLQKIFDEKRIVDIHFSYLTLSARIEKRAKSFGYLVNYCDGLSCKRVRSYARFKIAELHRRFSEYQSARTIYKKLIEEWKSSKDNIVTESSRGNQPESTERVDGDAWKVVRRKRRTVYMLYPLHELEGGLYLNDALEAIECEEPDEGAGPCTGCDNRKFLRNIRQAIECGSLEAGYLFLHTMEDHFGRYFETPLLIPNILARISLLNEGKLSKIHTEFKLLKENAALVSENERSCVISDMVERHLKYDRPEPCLEDLTTEYGRLHELRRQLWKLERALILAPSDWNELCGKASISLFRYARESLDHLIDMYQKEVFGKGHEGNSLFPIHVDWGEASTNVETTKNKLKGWAEPRFPGYSLPDEVFDVLLKVQPMYDAKNRWLAALGQTSGAKHAAGVKIGKTFHLKLNDADPVDFDTITLARQICEEVEKLTLYFFNRYENMRTSGEFPLPPPVQKKSEKGGEKTKSKKGNKTKGKKK